MSRLPELSNSAIDLYRSCPRKFKEQILDNNKPVEEPSIPLDYGSALHAGLETYLMGENGHAVFEMMLRMSKAFKRHGELDKFLAMGAIHLDKFKKYQLKHFTDITCEKRLFSTLGAFKIAGTPDVVCKYRGVWSIVDFKTSQANFNKDLIYTLPQMKMYAMMLKELGQHIDQLVYIVFTKTGEFSIQTLTRRITSEEIIRFAKDLSQEINSISVETNYRKNPHACHSYGRPCAFIKKCFPELEARDAGDDTKVP